MQPLPFLARLANAGANDGAPGGAGALDGGEEPADGDEEFQGAFAENAQKEGIVLQTREPGDVNHLAVNDRAIQTVKQTLFREMGKSGTTKWVDKLPKSVQSYNKTPHEI